MMDEDRIKQAEASGVAVLETVSWPGITPRKLVALIAKTGVPIHVAREAVRGILDAGEAEIVHDDDLPETESAMKIYRREVP